MRPPRPSDAQYCAQCVLCLCAMSLAQPDMMFFGNQTISVPVAQTAVNFAAFMIVAPLTLLGLTIYLHVFLGHARRIAVVPEGDRLPTLFNMERGPGATVAYFVFYWLTPLVLSGFAWKAACIKSSACSSLWSRSPRRRCCCSCARPTKGKPFRQRPFVDYVRGRIVQITDGGCGCSSIEKHRGY